MKTTRLLCLATSVLLAGALTATAQQTTPQTATPPPAPKPMSPVGTAAVHVGGQYVKTERGQRYEGGKWIEITYNRPLLRGRANIFGAGAEYGKAVSAGSPVWRLGANQTTRLSTEVPLKLGDKTLAPGEYSLFVELKEGAWTLIVSTWGAQQKYDPADKTALWGSYNYTPDKDVVRVPMKLEQARESVEQLTIGFVDMTATGGKLSIAWDRTHATVPFGFGG